MSQLANVDLRFAVHAPMPARRCPFRIAGAANPILCAVLVAGKDLENKVATVHIQCHTSVFFRLTIPPYFLYS